MIPTLTIHALGKMLPGKMLLLPLVPFATCQIRDTDILACHSSLFAEERQRALKLCILTVQQLDRTYACVG